MKKCPYCAEDIQDAAIKCKHCGEFLDGSRPPGLPGRQSETLPWYCKTGFMVITFLMFPPFVLPSVWLHPGLHLAWKLVMTVVVIAACWTAFVTIREFMHQYDEMLKMMRDGGLI